MKKLICLCLIVLAFGALCITAGATGTERAILASGEKVQQGKTIAFSVTLADCGEISGYTVELVYEATVFQLHGATWQPSDKPFGLETNDGTFILEAPQIPDNSPILSFTLIAAEDAPLDTVIPVTCNITLHTEAEDIPVAVEPVNITITCPHDFQKNATAEYLRIPATCTEAAEYYKSCTRCGVMDETQIFISGGPLSHNFKDQEMPQYLAEAGDCRHRALYYISCVACGLKGEQTFEGRALGQHIYDNDCDAKCNVCFEEREVTHPTTEGWQSNEKGHWHNCSQCAEKVGYVKHNPGPEATPETPQTCTDCGFVLKLYEPHVHDFGQNWLTDENGHWQVCQCGEETEHEPHPWDTTDPTLYSCPVCGAGMAVAAPEEPTTPEETTPSEDEVIPLEEQPGTVVITKTKTKEDPTILLVALILGAVLMLSLIANVIMFLKLSKKKKKSDEEPAENTKE